MVFGDDDTIGFDTTGDGKVDAVEVDLTGDGERDSIAYDTTGDGKVDEVNFWGLRGQLRYHDYDVDDEGGPEPIQDKRGMFRCGEL